LAVTLLHTNKNVKAAP